MSSNIVFLLQYTYYDSYYSQEHHQQYQVYAHLICLPIFVQHILQRAAPLLKIDPRSFRLAVQFHKQIFLISDMSADPFSMQFQLIYLIDDHIQHFIYLCIVLLKLLHQFLLVVIHVPGSILIILRFLVLLGSFHDLFPGLEHHLVFYICLCHDLDPQFPLGECVLVGIHVSEHLQVRIQPF